MNKYELVLIFKPELSEEGRNTVFSRIQRVTDESDKLGEVHDWGKRKLVYEINYIKEGYYCIVNLDLDPQFVKEIERRCKLFDQIIRHMVVRVDEQQSLGGRSISSNVSLMSRLTRDPEVGHSVNTQLANVRFSVAVDRRLSREKRMEAENSNQPATDSINRIAFRKTAEVIGQYSHKGNRIAITSHVQAGFYEDQQGQRIYTTDVIVDQLDFVKSNNSQSNSGSYQGYNSNNQSFNNNSFQDNNLQDSNDVHGGNDNFGMGDNAVPTDIDEPLS